MTVTSSIRRRKKNEEEENIAHADDVQKLTATDYFVRNSNEWVSQAE